MRKADTLVLAAVLLSMACQREQPVASLTRVCIDAPAIHRAPPLRTILFGGFRPTVVLPNRARWIPERPHLRLRLRVCFVNGDSRTRARVRQYADEWTKYAFIQFAYGSDPQSEIKVWFANDGYCQTAVGSDAVLTHGATMHYGWLNADTPDEEFRRTVLHEFGHALGLVHEHQSPATGIHWDEATVISDCARDQHWTPTQVRQNILMRYENGQTQYSTFDPQSIMIYPIPALWTTDGYHTDWNNSLSTIDMEYIAKLYPR